MDDRNELLVRWMNSSFETFKGKRIDTLLVLKNPELVNRVLLEIDEQFFNSVELVVDGSEKSAQYSMMSIYKCIKTYYKEANNIELEDNFFNIKEAVKDDNYDDNLIRPLVELIAGLTTLCPKQHEFIEIMKTFDEEDQGLIHKILTERIYADSIKKNANDSEDDESNTHLHFRIENLTLEINKLKDENEDLKQKNIDLVKQNFNIEISLKESKKENDELLALISLMEKKEEINKPTLQETDVNSFSLKIQNTELKSKLEAKEESLKKVLIDKEKLETDYKKKLFNMQAELEIYREKSIKFDILNEKYEKQLLGEDIKSLKQKVEKYEKNIKELELQLKNSRNDSEKNQLFKKIEELTFENMKDKETIERLTRETDHYKSLIVQLERENKMKELELEDYKHTEYESEINFKNKNIVGGGTSLLEVEEEHDKKRLLELETQVKVLSDQSHSLTVENSDLKELVRKGQVEFQTSKRELEELSKLQEKNKQYKIENKEYLNKLTEQISILNQNRIEIDNLKLMKEKEAVDIENKFNKLMMQTNIANNESIMKFKETINKLQTDNELLRKELKNNEELLETKQLLINEIQNRNSQSQKDSKQLEYELKIKELTNTENLDLKQKLKDKEVIVKKLEQQLAEAHEKAKSLEVKAINNGNHVSIEELNKKEDLLKLYKQNFENKEKVFIEEQRLLSTLIYELGLQHLVKGKLKPNGQS